MSRFSNSFSASRIAHRPWPAPARSWFMTMRWYDLLFAHWPVPASVLEPLVPSGLEVETWDGSAWLAVVPFRMSDVGPRGFGWLPGVSRFAELNVRTYVCAKGKPGVWFFSLDAESKVAVEMARRGFHLPYVHARMSVSRGSDGWIAYHTTRTDRRARGAEFRGRYRAKGPPVAAARGSFDEFLTERYCLYAADSRGRVLRGEVHHEPWPLQAAELELDTNTMASAAGITLPDTPPVLHFAESIDVVAWSLDVV